MGRPWTNDAQLKWLQARRGSFLLARQNGHLDRFFNATYDAWFETFPLLFADLTLPPGAVNPNHDEDLQKAITARKKQIFNWFTWNTRSSRPSNGASPTDNALLNALNGINSQEPRKHAPQRVEAYVHLYQDKVKAVVDQALLSVLDPAHRLNVRRCTVSTMLSNESADVQDEVTEYIRQWKMDQEENKVKSAMEKPSVTPGEFQAAIKLLPAFLKMACTAASAATGWPIFIATGGPTPIANGNLHMQTFYFGANSVSGNTFEQSFADFEDSFSLPFSRHLRSCFPTSVCKARSLENPIPSQSAEASSSTDPNPLASESMSEDQGHRSIPLPDPGDSDLEVDTDVAPGQPDIGVTSTVPAPMNSPIDTPVDPLDYSILKPPF